MILKELAVMQFIRVNIIVQRNVFGVLIDIVEVI